MAIDRDRADRIGIPPEMRTKTDLSCIAQPATPTAITRVPDLTDYIEEERKRWHA